MCPSICGPGWHEKPDCYNRFGAPNLEHRTDHVWGVPRAPLMPTIPLNMLNNWHKFGLHRATYARVLPTALQGIMKREKRIREIAARAQILKNSVCTKWFWRAFLKIKNSISALETAGTHTPKWVRNYPERVPHRWGDCISPHSKNIMGGWGWFLPGHPLYIYI